jgi:hypothetical protein
MRRPGDTEREPKGGRAAERLREFLKERLPPGASPEELNPEAAKSKKENEDEGGCETDGDHSTSSGNHGTSVT